MVLTDSAPPTGALWPIHRPAVCRNRAVRSGRRGLAEAPKASPPGSRALSAPGPTVPPAPPQTRGSLFRSVSVKHSGSLVTSSGHLLSALPVHTEKSVSFPAWLPFSSSFVIPGKPDIRDQTKANKARAPKGENKLPPPVFWSFLAFHPSSPTPLNLPKQAGRQGPNQCIASITGKCPIIRTITTLEKERNN